MANHLYKSKTGMVHALNPVQLAFFQICIHYIQLLATFVFDDHLVLEITQYLSLHNSSMYAIVYYDLEYEMF